MKNFKELIEEWASKYKPMLHTPGETGKNKRVFLFDNITSIPSFMAKLPDTKSPCVGYEYPAEGNIKGGKDMPEHVIYFMVKAHSMQDNSKEFSSEAVREAKTHLFKFIAWLRRESDRRPELRNLNLETESIRYSTYGPFMNNWYAVFVEISDVEKFDACVDENDYIE